MSTASRSVARLPKRPTLGFLTASLHVGAGRTMWLGLADAAEKHDFNLVCFPGGRWQAAENYEAQRNAVYNLVAPERLSGLVTWSSAIGGALAPAEMTVFHRRFRPLPMVSLAHLSEDVPVLLADSYQGMRAAILHLVETHGYRHLAFVRGPEKHYYAQQRYQAYTDILREYSLPFQTELVTPPLQWEAGAQAVQILLEERQLRPGIDFQAIVAVSDLLAFDIIRALQTRGWRIPTDLAVIGFNDSIEGRLSLPPLTSVASPFYERGYRAAEMLLKLVAGETLPAQITLPSHLVVRQSCGCPSVAVSQAALGPLAAHDLELAAALTAQRPVCLREMNAALAAEASTGRAWPGLVEQVWDAFLADLHAAPPGCFLPAMEKILEALPELDGTAWQSVLSALRRHILPYLVTPARALAEDLVGQARVLVGDMAQHALAYQHWQNEQQANRLRTIGQALLTTFDLNQLAEVLTTQLPQLGIASAYLALYDAPLTSLEYARLALAYTESGRLPLADPAGQRFLARQLLPEAVWPRHRRVSFIVEPLYFQNLPLGFALLEVGPRDSIVYETLRGHLSSALKGAQLFQEAQQARVAAEKANQIKTRLLANVSHELRTPLNIILGHTQAALTPAHQPAQPPPPAWVSDLQHIQQSAEHQLRVINDLLDLSRAEIDELDLSLEWLDPAPLLAEAFHSLADQATSTEVVWRWEVPDRLPVVQADAVRLRQILLNLLSNAGKFTPRGHITLGVEVAPPHLHIWVADTGPGIPLEQQEHIFEPFATSEHAAPAPGGIGLGLSISRHLATLHGGTLTVVSQPGQGSTFHVHLPLPHLSAARPPELAGQQSVLLLISAAGQPAPEVLAFSQRQGLEIRQWRPGDNWEDALAEVRPVALAWDLSEATPAEWALVRRLRHHPHLFQAPFVLYGQLPAAAAGEPALTMGLTSFMTKPVAQQTLLETLQALCPAHRAGPVLIVDDDAEVRAAHQALVNLCLPEYPVRVAGDGAAALASLAAEVPSLVLLDLMMPGVSGAEVLDHMRADPRLRQVPVIVLSNKILNHEDVKHLERHAHVILQSKGVWTEAEAAAALNRTLFGVEALPPQTGALAKRAVAYLQQNYARPLARWEIAEAVGVSEDYLSRVFNRELGISPWDYLTRYRVNQAKRLLLQTSDSIRSIASLVGFKDQAYFSRVFHKLTGTSPHAFRGASPEP